MLDFGILLAGGKDATEAAIKATGHLGAGLAGFIIGSAIPAPVLGPIAGFTAGVLGSMAFDWCYDNADMLIVGAQNVGNAIVDKVTDTGEKIGEAVSGFFGDLGSVFS